MFWHIRVTDVLAPGIYVLKPSLVGGVLYLYLSSQFLSHHPLLTRVMRDEMAPGIF
jgi:hypothetical protein